ncbi:phage tail protein [Providencia sp. R33]|uniref:phage baseplate protein n=1 Tax=Providencia sp. R33 TaxID=2828763 RepID=UPI001C5AF9EE|nr:phage tail protein [Providencia sp. R33]QXX83460.1 phage tail protein [Providencia sp. R33]
MTKIFKIPFATQGDRTSIPDDVQADGAVSYTQGYSYDYERDQQTDPAAKDIEREKMNGIFHDITQAIGELQSFGFPKWAAEGRPYPIRAIVYHKNKTWQSKIENNNVEPVAGTAWQELKADLSAGDINVYTKTESDKRFQPLGNYQPAGYSYSKAESDTNYQPKGNYAPAGNYALKGDSYTKAEGDTRYQAKGSYQPSGDYATNTALNNGLNNKLNTSSVVQSTGASTTSVMSQKAVTDALQNAVNLNTIYPIGIVVWFAQNKNPNTLFPGTKWQYIGENKTIRLAAASGANVLTTGGSDSVTIGKNHLPATPLKFSGTTASGGAHDHTRGTMNITGELGYMRSDSAQYSYATGAFSLAGGAGNGGYTGNNNTGSRKYIFNAASTWSGSTSQHGGHSHTYSGNTENLGSGAVLAVTNAYIMLMGWYRIS